MTDAQRGMTFIVKTVTRLTLGFILLYGIYIGLAGHVSPGGGFAGGVIIALAFIHIMLAFGKETALRRLRTPALRVMMCCAALLFLCFALWAPARIRAFSCEVILPSCEMAVVSIGLFTIFIALVLVSKKDKDAE
jgi:multicomponent Na+:H+ antiporter subunit B